MCLIVLAWRKHPDFPLIVAANRDEFHARPAAPAAFWEDQPGILAGRDRIASTVTVSAADGTPLGRYEVETRNLSAFGSTQGLIERHAEEVVARLADCFLNKLAELLQNFLHRFLAEFPVGYVARNQQAAASFLFH